MQQKQNLIVAWMIGMPCSVMLFFILMCCLWQYKEWVGASLLFLLFLVVEEEAKEAERVVDEQVAPLDSYIDEDTDGTITYEVRFLTEKKLTELEAAGIIHLTQPDSYAVNSETF